MKYIAIIAFLFAALITGCTEDKKMEVTLNPDGSGMVVFEILSAVDAQVDMNFNNTKPRDDVSKIKQTREKFIKNSEGLDAIPELTVDIYKGYVRIRGKGYFSDFNKLVLSTGASKTDYNPSGHFQFTPSGNSSPAKIHLKSSDKKSKKKASENNLTPQQRYDRFIAQRGIMLDFFSLVMAHKKWEMTVNLPGDIISEKGFKKLAPKQAYFIWDGKKIFAKIKEYSMDDAKVKKLLESDDSANTDISKMFMQEVIGIEQPPEVTFKSGKPQFDYTKAVAEANKSDALTSKTTKINTGSTKEATGESDVAKPGSKDFKVLAMLAEIKYELYKKTYSNNKWGNEYSPAFTIELLLKASGGKMIEVADFMTDEIKDDQGNILIAKGEHHVWDIRNNECRVNLKFAAIPPKQMQQLAKLSGTMDAICAGEVETTKFKNAPLKNGSKFGKSITITEVNNAKNAFTLKVNIDKEKIKQLIPLDSSGKKLDLSGTRNWSSNTRKYSSSTNTWTISNYTSYTFTLRGKLPDSIGFELEQYKETTTNKIKWEIDNLPLRLYGK